MPRLAQSKIGMILEFFRSSSLEIAEFAYAQVQDVMRERHTRQSKGKAAAGKVKQQAGGAATPADQLESIGAAGASAGTPPKRAKVAKKKAKAKKGGPVPQALPDVGADTTIAQPAGDLIEEEFAEQEQVLT